MIRLRMGWLQLRRFLSFLPAAFFVYILLHYLIYQPIIPDSQTFIPDRSSLNESSNNLGKGDSVDGKLPEGFMRLKEEKDGTNFTFSQTVNSENRVMEIRDAGDGYSSTISQQDRKKSLLIAENLMKQPVSESDVKEASGDKIGHEYWTAEVSADGNREDNVDETKGKDSIFNANELNFVSKEHSYESVNREPDGINDVLTNKEANLDPGSVTGSNHKLVTLETGKIEGFEYGDGRSEKVENLNNFPYADNGESPKSEQEKMSSSSVRAAEQSSLQSSINHEEETKPYSGQERNYNVDPEVSGGETNSVTNSETYDYENKNSGQKAILSYKETEKGNSNFFVTDNGGSPDNFQEPMIVPRELLSNEEKSLQSSGREENLSISVLSNVSGPRSSTPLKEPQTLLPLPKGGLLSADGGDKDLQPEQNLNSKEGSQRNNPDVDHSSDAGPADPEHLNEKPQRQLQQEQRHDQEHVQQKQEQQPQQKKEQGQQQKNPQEQHDQKPEESGKQSEDSSPQKKTQPAQKKLPPPKRPPPPPQPVGFAINSLKGKITIGDKYEKGFTTPHEELCPNNGRDLKVLILITTAPDHERHRNAVRQTWGHFALRKDVAIGFMVGRTSRVDVQAIIDKENDRYGDIIEANFIDHYANLTLKTVSMFEWAKTYCSEARFVLKTDDDMFINVPLLLAFINAKRNERRAMFGRLAKGWKPVRNKKSKYYIDTATYGRVRYPDFLTGPAYLFTNDIVEEVYNKALNTTFFVLEDVLLTGFVGESLKVKRVGDSHFRNEKIKLTDTCKLMQSISIHMVKYEEQFDIYKRTLDGKTKCKTR